MLTGIKDIEILILNKLDDKDLLNYCLVNKQTNSLYNDDMLWINRIITKFPELKELGTVKDVKDKYRKNLTYKDYYVDLVDNLTSQLMDVGRKGRLDVIVILLNRNIIYNINLVLTCSGAFGHLEVMKYLGKHGGDIHHDSEWPLRWASNLGKLKVVKYLVENGADIHAISDLSLRLASQRGRLNVVKYLVENGANINAINGEALISASKRGYLNIVKCLVKHGAANIQRARDEAFLTHHLDVGLYLQSILDKK